MACACFPFCAFWQGDARRTPARKSRTLCARTLIPPPSPPICVYRRQKALSFAFRLSEAGGRLAAMDAGVRGNSLADVLMPGADHRVAPVPMVGGVVLHGPVRVAVHVRAFGLFSLKTFYPPFPTASFSSRVLPRPLAVLRISESSGVPDPRPFRAFPGSSVQTCSKRQAWTPVRHWAWGRTISALNITAPSRAPPCAVCNAEGLRLFAKKVVPGEPP